MPGRYLQSLDEIIRIQHNIQDIHPFLEKAFPVAIVEGDRFLIYEPDCKSDQYHFVDKMPTPLPIPLGVRAAFPLNSDGSRMACVVTGEVFDTLDGYVTIFHEFIHCQQFETCEQKIKQTLRVAQKARAAGDFMWEINHPFPYDDAGFTHAYAQCLALTPENDIAALHAIRQELKHLLTLEDYEYMAWQEWKEGFARWIENRIQKRLGLPENKGGDQSPFSRVSFYAGGARTIDHLRRWFPGIESDLENLFLRMYQA
jgi:hypothetical protein